MTGHIQNGCFGFVTSRLLSLYAYYLGRRLILTIIIYEIKYSEQMEQMEQMEQIEQIEQMEQL